MTDLKRSFKRFAVLSSLVLLLAGAVGTRVNANCSGYGEGTWHSWPQGGGGDCYGAPADCGYIFCRPMM